MSEFDVMIEEYPGDTRWQEFVAVFRSEWDAQTDSKKAFFRSTIGDDETAIVLASKMGDQALDWWSKPWGVLRQRSAVDIMKNERHGLKIIKSVLMRMQ